MAIYELDGVAPQVAASAWVADSAEVMGNVVGVQVVAGRYREDLCLAAGEAIEAAGPLVTIAEPAVG